MTTNLVNGQLIEIQFADGRKGVVQMKRLSIRQLYDFVEYCRTDQTPALVALCCGQEIEWIDTLADESFTTLAEEAIKQNFHRAAKLAEKDPIIAAKFAPILVRFAQMADSMRAFEKSTGPLLKGSSDAPAPTESAAATGSASSNTPSPA